MSLEEEIQQKAFRNEYQKAILNLLYTQNYLVGKMTEVFKQFDITRQQYNVLRILRGQYPKPASINLIKDRMLEKMSDTSRIVERLRIKGLIQREEGKTDKRAAEITITPPGIEQLKRMQTQVEDFEAFVANLSIEEARQLNSLLDKLRIHSMPETEKLFHSLDLLNQTEKI
jgi:DNA-binding MarR family transcriptional regulator